VRHALLALVVVVATACAATSTAPPAIRVRDLAGTWQGRLAMQAGNAAASLTIKDDGTYAGTMHFERDERLFTGAIVEARPGRLRYLGSHGDGAVVVRPQTVPATMLRFVPDGGGGGGSFTRVQ
jgi:hypothetical protein